MPSVRSLALVLILATSALAAAAGTVPRPSPEFAISPPERPGMLLSSFRGKVVVLEFLFIGSQHCLRVATTLNKLYGELGARGFQPLGVVFDPPNVRRTGAELIAPLQSGLRLAFPIGYASKEQVDSYLGRTGNEILNIPQVVVIDRAGRIRATSGGRGGDPALEDESSLRRLIENLLKEEASADSGQKLAPVA